MQLDCSSMAPDFFIAEGEPYDINAPTTNDKNQPTSVYSAIRMIPEEDWVTMCLDFYPDTDPVFVDVESIYQKILETNVLVQRVGYVECWIDPEGFYRVKVYE